MQYPSKTPDKQCFFIYYLSSSWILALPVSYKYSLEASAHKRWIVEMNGASAVIFPQLGLEADWREYNKHHCRENKYLANLQMDILDLDIYIFKGLTYLDSGPN